MIINEFDVPLNQFYNFEFAGPWIHTINVHPNGAVIDSVNARKITDGNIDIRGMAFSVRHGL